MIVLVVLAVSVVSACGGATPEPAQPAEESQPTATSQPVEPTDAPTEPPAESPTEEPTELPEDELVAAAEELVEGAQEALEGEIEEELDPVELLGDDVVAKYIRSRFDLASPNPLTTTKTTKSCNSICPYCCSTTTSIIYRSTIFYYIGCNTIVKYPADLFLIPLTLVL